VRKTILRVRKASARCGKIPSTNILQQGSSQSVGKKHQNAENYLFKGLDDVVHVVGLGHPNRRIAFGVRQCWAVKT